MSNAAVASKRAYRIITVTINTGSAPTVDPDPVRVSKNYKDEIVWECTGDPNFDVNFNNRSPFTRSRFDRNNNHSGPASAEGTYKYSVTAGGVTVDPATIVDP